MMNDDIRKLAIAYQNYTEQERYLTRMLADVRENRLMARKRLAAALPVGYKDSLDVRSQDHSR